MRARVLLLLLRTSPPQSAAIFLSCIKLCLSAFFSYFTALRVGPPIVSCTNSWQSSWMPRTSNVSLPPTTLWMVVCSDLRRERSSTRADRSMSLRL